MQILILILCSLMFGNVAYAGNAQPIRVACIGDSLTEVAATRADLPWVSLLEINTSGLMAGNTGLGGSKSADHLGFWTNRVRNKGYTHLILWSGVNDLATDVAMATIQGNITTIVSQALSDGMTVAIVNIAPWSTYTGSNGTRQTNTDTLNAWIAAYSGVTKIDVRTPLGKSGAPAELAAAYDAVDHLHHNGAAQVVIASTVKTAMGW